jgi:phosphotriesterase-related protein
MVRCIKTDHTLKIQTVSGLETPMENARWLSHEHVLVDFIGADSIRPETWNHDTIMKEIIPYIKELYEYDVNYFVEATPNFLGRDVRLLEQITKRTGLKIITNTGLYGFGKNKHIPAYAFEKSAQDLAEMWTKEYRDGIDGTGIKPGFIKISVESGDTLEPMHQKLVEAAALTHLETGLTIASHTGPAMGLWPQLEILKQKGVSPESFIWIHAQNENDPKNYLAAAEKGCWISFDGLAWEMEQHLEKLLYAKDHGILDQILISHDAGWFDPKKPVQTIQPYTTIFKHFYLKLIANGFTEMEFEQLVTENPSKAFSIHVRRL